MKKDITDLFVFIDDFCKATDLFISNHMLTNKEKLSKPTRVSQMSTQEIITIILLYQQSPCKNFKYFYNSYLQLYKVEFPNLVSYERFVTLKPRILMYLQMLLNWIMSLSQKICKTHRG